MQKQFIRCTFWLPICPPWSNLLTMHLILVLTFLNEPFLRFKISSCAPALFPSWLNLTGPVTPSKVTCWYMLWFNCILGSNIISPCFLGMVMLLTLNQKEIKFKPRIKLNHNLYIRCAKNAILFHVKLRQETRTP